MKVLNLLLALLLVVSSALPQAIFRGQNVGASVSPSIEWVTGQILGTPRNDFTGCVGSTFTVGLANITVTDLGRWVISGNSGSHTLVLQAFDSPFTGLGSVSINTSGAPTGAFLYGSITPVVLTAGIRYVVLSNETNAGDQWYNDNTIITTTTDAVNLQDANAGSCPGSVSNAQAAPNAYVPVSFKYHL